MKNLGQFLREVRWELSKITWPSSREFIGATVIVLILIVAFSVYLGVVDFGFAWLAKYVFVEFGS